MRRKTVLLITILGLLLASLLSLTLSSVQTSLANQAMRRFGIDGSIHALSVGWSGFEATGVELVLPSAALTVPRVEGRLGLRALLRGQLEFGSFRGDGAVLNLQASILERDSKPLSQSESLRLGLESLRSSFTLPFPLRIADLQLTGEVRPVRSSPIDGAQPITFHLRGTILPEAASRLEAQLYTRTADRDQGWIELNARLTAALRFFTPTQLERVTLSSSVSATGLRFPNGAVLSTRAEVALENGAISIDCQAYAAGDSDRRELLNIRAGTDAAADAVKGRWSIDLNQSDIAPYSMGRPLPLFTLKGNGGFVLADGLRVAGELDADIPRPGELYNGLVELGEMKVRGVFDVQRLGDRWRIHRLSTRASSGPALLAVQLLQTVERGSGPRPWLVANPDGDVLSAEWQGLDLDLLPAKVGPWRSSGVLQRGGATARFTGQSWEFRSLRPQVVRDWQLHDGESAVARPLELHTDFSGVIRSEGWQLDVLRMSLHDRERRLAVGSAVITQRGATEWDVTGEWDGDLATLDSVWPEAAVSAELVEGAARARVAFASKTEGTWQSQVDVLLRHLRTRSGELLPEITSSFRADRGSEGGLDLEIPLLIGTGDTVSDLLILSHVAPRGEAVSVETVVSAKRLHLPQVRSWWNLYDLATQGWAQGSRDLPRPGAERPFWAAVTGELKLSLNEVYWPERSQPLRVEMQAKASPSVLRMDRVVLLSPDGSRAEAKGEIEHQLLPNRTGTYHGAGVIEAREFDPGPYLMLFDQTNRPWVRGKFDLDLSFKTTAATWAGIFDQAQATVVLTGRGGIFHAFDESALVADFTKATTGGSRLSNLVGKATSLFSKTDRKVAAGTDFVRRMAAIAYDQATFEIALRPGQDIEVREFSLISPELRLVGSGRWANDRSKPWTQRPLQLEMDVSVRGTNESDLRTLGVLGEKSDSLGYFSLGQPIRFSGTWRELETSSLVDYLSAAIAK